VIKDANHDLGFAAGQRAAVSMDTLHARVVANRFDDDAGWRLRGFAVPVLFPDVGDWPWDAITDLRRDRAMARFRAILGEVEEEAAAEAVRAATWRRPRTVPTSVISPAPRQP
jgi:hypothetical protein